MNAATRWGAATLEVIEGSPKSSISTVPMMPWQTGGGERVEAECGDREVE